MEKEIKTVLKTNDLACSNFIQSIDKLSRIVHTYPCEKKVVATIQYKSTIDGRPCSENVCKTHLNCAKKFAERVKKRTEYDIKLRITELS